MKTSGLTVSATLALLLLSWGRAGAPRPEGFPVAGALGRVDRQGFLLRSGGWSWGLGPSAWGRPGALRGWDARLLEARYERRPEGLEQAFVVHRRPPGEGPLVLDQSLRGDLLPMRVEGSGAAFGKGGLALASYTGLKVTDAGGRELPSRMRWTGTALRMEVEDAGARYPVLVDPLATTAQWIVESSQAGATFGWVTLPAGDVNGDGYSDVIVGAPLYDNGQANEGRAFVFHGGSAGLSTAAAWAAESNQASAQFGFYAGPAGDLNGDGFKDVVVGVPYYDNGIVDEGRAYVYLGSSAGLSTTASWVVESNQTSAFFGICVAGAGDVNADGYSDLAVGAKAFDNGENNEGKIFVYHGASAGLSTTAAFTHESNKADVQFGGTQYGGRELSSAGDVNGDGYSDLVVGAYSFANGEAAEGRVYLYHGSSTGLGLAVVFEPNVASTQFGVSTTSAGDVNGDGYSDVIVGCPIWTNGEANEGRALVYHGASGGLNTAAAWTAESNQAGADYGWTTWHGDMDGDGYSDVIVGSDGYSNGETNEGRAFVYHGSSTGLSTAASWIFESNQASGVTGYSMGTADVNGDGFSDVLADAQGYDNGEVDEGRAHCFHSNPGTVSYNTYDLPGTKRMQDLHPLGNSRIEHTNNRVVRDSSGFYYFVWQPFADNADSTRDVILLSYTTTSTPTASTDWSTVTLVDGGGTDVIGDGLTDEWGWSPALAMASNDELHFAFAGDGANPTPFSYFWTKCSNLSALTDAASWAAVQQVSIDDSVRGEDIEDVDLALDSNDVLHIVYVDNATAGNPVVRYSKYDTASGAFLASKLLTGFDYCHPRIDIDLDNNVYVLYHPTAAPWNAYLLASTNAWSTAPNQAAWKDLAQSTTDPDTIATLAPFSSAALCVDRNGLVHVMYPNSTLGVSFTKGRLMAGWQGGPGLAGAWKRPVALTAFGNGQVCATAVKGGGASRDAIQMGIYYASATYRGDDGIWGFPPSTSDLAEGRSQALWTERKAPPNRTDTLWFVADAQRQKISVSWTDRAVYGSGWRVPTPVKQQRHPHFHWAFPNASTDFGSLGPPVVAQTLRSSVYTADPAAAGVLFAVDRATGTLSRSYALAGTPGQVTAATYGGNVHLFIEESANGILKLAHTASGLVFDAAWANNPRVLGANVTRLLPPYFLLESGTQVRYLYALGDGTGTGGGLFKLKADNGVLAAGFPFGEGGYQANYAEPQLRVLNDQVFAAGLSTQILRRESDGSAQIASSAVANQVLHLIQVRGSDNNRLFVAPEDKAVWLLTSGLKTTDWTAGTSANFGAVKTSGAYYTRYRNAVLVGVGNQLYRLNVSAGTIWANWPMATTGNIVSLPVEWRTFVYFGTDSGRLYAVNATTNVARANWPVLLDSTVSTPSVANLAFDAVTGHVYFATNEGRIYKFQTE